jgi:Tfp pilus assembly protein PilZ
VTAEPVFGDGGLNRRRAERVPMPATGGFVSVFGGRVVNVSPYGMMIESPVPLERDSVLQLRLVVGGEKVDVETRVAACTLLPGGKRRVFGIGLEFAMIRSEVQDRIREFLARPAAPAARA